MSGVGDRSAFELRDRLLEEMSRYVESLLLIRYHAKRSVETTEQAHMLANAALAALDDFTVEHRHGEDGGGTVSADGTGEVWPSTLYARLVGPWRVAQPGGRPRAYEPEYMTDPMSTTWEIRDGDDKEANMTVWIVTNGTGGQVNSAWDSETAADGRAAALNRATGGEELAWSVLALPVQQAVAAE